MTIRLAELTREAWPTASYMDKMPSRVWIGPEYLVQEYQEDNGIIRLTVNATRSNGRSWADRIPWDDLQDIKSACGYGLRDAVEIYPRTEDVVNVANMRHLWVLPEVLPFGWRRNR